MNHYVYRTFLPDTGEFYIGSRSTSVSPETDKYKGSGFWVLFNSRRKELMKEILSVHPSRESANSEENKLVRKHFGEKLCMNRRVAKCRSHWRKRF